MASQRIGVLAVLVPSFLSSTKLFRYSCYRYVLIDTFRAATVLGLFLVSFPAGTGREQFARGARRVCGHAHWGRQIAVLPIARSNDARAHCHSGIAADCVDAGPDCSIGTDGGPRSGLEQLTDCGGAIRYFAQRKNWKVPSTLSFAR